MKEKNKLIALIIILLILIFILGKLIKVNSIKYTVTSENTKFNISEIHNDDTIYFEITNGKFIYPISIFDSIKEKRLINKIYSYKDKEYSCILPIINNDIYTDIMCIKDNTIYNYQSIKGNDKKLDDYVSTLSMYKTYETNDDYKTYNNVIKVYNNIDKIISITTYKGIFINDKEIQLFNDDIYSNELNSYIDKYYITADYNSKYEFSDFYVVNLENENISKINSKQNISFDSYIQGIVDNKVYLYDTDNEIQYEIDIENNQINIVSNDEYIKYYRNNKWEKLGINKLKNKEIYFEFSDYSNKFPDYDCKYENDYYYYLIKNEKQVSNRLYRLNKNNLDIIEYLFDLPTDNIKLKDNYIYYIYKDSLYYYSDKTNIVKVLSDTELNFNDKIKYYIY